MLAIENINDLVFYVQNTDKNNAQLAIKEYGNRRVKMAIDRSWFWFEKLLKRIDTHKSRRIRNQILNYDEAIGAITLREFTRFFTSVEDELISQMQMGSWDVRKAAENIHDLMTDKLGDIKIDRRTIFSNEDK